jgi:hypothetical protein
MTTTTTTAKASAVSRILGERSIESTGHTRGYVRWTAGYIAEQGSDRVILSYTSGGSVMSHGDADARAARRASKIAAAKDTLEAKGYTCVLENDYLVVTK